MKKYCYRDYDLFVNGWMSVIWLNYEGEGEIYAALSSQVFGTKKEAMTYLSGLAKVLLKEKRYVSQKVTLFKLKLKKKFRNRRGYWTKIKNQEKIEDGTYNEKISWLVPFLKSPVMYDVLVVVRGKFGDNVIFDVARVFLKSKNSDRMEKFMYYSKQVVDEKAKYSAVYEVTKRLAINWKTKEEREEKMNNVTEDDLLD